MNLFKKILDFFANPYKKNIGYVAENAAAKFLKESKHLKIIAQNYRFKKYETDIVAYDKSSDTIIFAEVKCRPDYAKVRGFFAATTRHKKDCLKKSARAFLRENNAYNKNIRFDVVEVEHDKNLSITAIRHIENAFF